VRGGCAGSKRARERGGECSSHCVSLSLPDWGTQYTSILQSGHNVFAANICRRAQPSPPLNKPAPLPEPVPPGLSFPKIPFGLGVASSGRIIA
jgi:hypothetical protein